MWRFRGLAAALAIGFLLLTSCTSLVTAYLINELLNDKAPKFMWRGTVTDTEARGIPDLTVRVRAETPGDDDVKDFVGLTNGTGQYAVEFKWHGHVSYRVQVLSDDVVLAERFVGGVSKGDQRDDFTLEGSASVEISGVVRDAGGNPLAGVLVIPGTAQVRGGTALPLRDGEGNIRHSITTESGVYTFTGSTQRYALVAAFHPDRGFAYAAGEDLDGDGAVGLNLSMGAGGEHQLGVQVVNGSGAAISNQVLNPAQQFRLRVSPGYDLSAAFDTVVEDKELFPLLVGAPSDVQPEAETLLVQSTGVDGMADTSLTVAGGSYQLEALRTDADTAATALIQGNNPRAVAGPTVVVVRVN